MRRYNESKNCRTWYNLSVMTNPNAEKNYADPLKFPAKRVHGVEGSDVPHKVAELSETDRFVTVDGDNTVRSKIYPPKF